MPVFNKALERLREATVRTEALATIFEHIGQMVDQFGAAASQLQLDWQKFDDEVLPGDLIPYITLGVRPATQPNVSSDQTRSNQARDEADAPRGDGA